jgi:hypothetical protein
MKNTVTTQVESRRRIPSQEGGEIVEIRRYGSNLFTGADRYPEPHLIDFDSGQVTSIQGVATP